MPWADLPLLRSSFICYRTSQYKLHYYETPTNIKFVMLTDTKANNMRLALHQIYVNLYVEYGETRSSHWIEFGVIT
jgi:hypothetical protein